MEIKSNLLQRYKYHEHSNWRIIMNFDVSDNSLENRGYNKNFNQLRFFFLFSSSSSFYDNTPTRNYDSDATSGFEEKYS